MQHFTFDDGRAPLRQAMTALTVTAMGNPQVPAPLQAMIERAHAMNHGVPAERHVAAVDRLVSLVGFDAADENVAAAIRHLEKAALEYRMWARINGRWHPDA